MYYYICNLRLVLWSRATTDNNLNSECVSIESAQYVVLYTDTDALII